MPATIGSKAGASSRLLLAAIVLTATLWGAGFWDKKDFTQWTDREVQRTMVNSPWAKKVVVSGGNAMDMLRSTGGGAGRRGGGGGGPGGGGGGGGGRRGPGGGGGFGGAGGQTPSMPMLELIVRFDEAMPVKHAKVKYNMGESTELTPEMQEYLSSETDYYVVNVENIPQALAARFQDEPERLATTARLRRKGHEDIYAAKVEVGASGQGIFRYYFVKNDPIELSDKEVEFYFKLERPQGAGRGPGASRPRGQGGQGGGQGGGGQRGAGAGQRPGGQGGGGPGAGQRPGGGPAQRAAMMLFGKEIKKKFRLKDMVYKGELAM